MAGTAIVDATRRALGPVGVFLPIAFDVAPSADAQRDAVRRLEGAGYRAAWTNEIIGGKDTLVQLAVLLAATEQMVLGSAIANIWARAPQTAHGGAALLTQAFPDRFVLGLGVGYPFLAEAVGREFGNPLATMRDYVEQLAAPTLLPLPDVTYPKILGATGPKMLALAGEIADGALPVMLPAEFTAHAREALGPDKLLVVGLGIVLDDDPEAARVAARATIAGTLSQPGTYANAMAQLGYSEQEIGAVSDRLVDATIAQGDPEAIAARVREHLAAGADHVMVMSNGNDYADGIDQLERLASALTAIEHR